jgi:hypothetical protein
VGIPTVLTIEGRTGRTSGCTPSSTSPSCATSTWHWRSCG